MQQRCANCGSPIVPGQRFCGGCGAQQSLSCPQCRITVSPGTRFCPNCGATLGGPSQGPGYGPGGGTPPQQPGWGQQPGMPPQQQPWGAPQQPWAPPAPKSQSSSSTRPLLVLLLFILLMGMGVLAYLQTPLGTFVKELIGISSNSGGNTTDTTPDTTKPVITFPLSPAVAATTARIDWTTDEPSSSQVEYGTTTTYGSLQPTTLTDDPTTGESLGVVTHSIVLSGLQPNTPYHYRVKSIDKAGNMAISDDRTFTTTEATTE